MYTAEEKLREPRAFDEQLGLRIKRIRSLRGITQTELAEVLGTSYQQIQRYESGRSRLPPECIALTAKLLKVSFSELMLGQDYEEYYQIFDKKTLTVAKTIARLPDKRQATLLYQLALTLTENDSSS